MESEAALEIFEQDHAEHLAAEVLDSLLETMLREHPDAPVTPMNETGIVVPVPETITLNGNPVVETRSASDAIIYDEDVLKAWQKLFAQGVARCAAHPVGHPEVTIMLCMLDLRERHGVLVSIALLGDLDAAEMEAAREEYSDAVPRFCRMTKDPQALILGVDDALTKILGWTAEDMAGRRSLEFIHPDDHQVAIENWMQMMSRSGLGTRVRLRHRRKHDDAWIWFEVTNQNLLEDPEHGCVITDMLDISEEMAAHEEIRARQQLLDRLAGAVPVGLLQIDALERVVYTNERLHQIVGVGVAETAREQLANVIEEDRERLNDAFVAALGFGSEADLEVQLRLTEDGPLRFCTVSLRPLSHEDDTVSGALACVTDITESARMREELKVRATFDDLTGCYNRHSIMLALESNIESSGGDRAVVFVDVDSFKTVNDECGHAVGDELLRAVARRLRAGVRDTDLVGRIGGDEFLLICPGIGGRDGAMKLAERLSRLVSEEPVAGVVPQVSVGVAWSDRDEVGADALVAAADEAMYESKRGGCGEPQLGRVG
jgi:diguanylate cyclase (GGDEF)-like protein/PAS domain S-box-containing protein